MRPLQLVYVAGPFSAPTAWGIELNIRRAEALGREVAHLGAYPVMPHANMRGYWVDEAPYEFWIAGTLQLMRRCDAVIVVPNWQESRGTRDEITAAADRVPCFYDNRDHSVQTLARLRVWLRTGEFIRGDLKDVVEP